MPLLHYAIVEDDSPLNEPDYEPEHPPVDGLVPDVVRRWGQRSQLRWFFRFRRELRGQDLDDLWVESAYHTGWCCSSCQEEFWEGYGPMLDGWCCCHQIPG
jgi:hypothetical protein